MSPSPLLAGEQAQLPQPLADWAAQLLRHVPQAERHATCASCAMCSEDSIPPGPRPIRFSPRTRCCTFRPALVNHAAGRLLMQTSMQQQLDRRMAAGEATPMGLRMGPGYQLLYRHASASAFGRAESLRCPHQDDDGGCGIWAARPSVCATWFCKHERGAVGKRLWSALHDCFGRAERVLSLWCMDEMGLGGRARQLALQAFDEDRFDAAAMDQRPDPQQQRQLWGPWYGREADFYRACAELVAPLDWARVEEIGGAELSALAAQAREAARAHDDLSVPDRLETGAFGVLGARHGRLWLHTYSDFDPLEVSADVLLLAARSQGGRVADLAEAHAAAGGRRPDRRLLRTLVDFGVLQAVDPPPGA